MEPESEEQFQLVLTNTASAGESLLNEVEIYTLYDDADWNNHDGADIQVAEGQPDVYVWKDADPGDPAAGQTYVYHIHAGFRRLKHRHRAHATGEMRVQVNGHLYGFFQG